MSDLNKNILSISKIIISTDIFKDKIKTFFRLTNNITNLKKSQKRPFWHYFCEISQTYANQFNLSEVDYVWFVCHLAFGFGFVFGFCLALKCHKKSKESRRKTERKEKTDRIAAHK